MALEEPAEGEKTVKVNGLDILLDQFARGFTDETVIDYIDEASGRGFIIKGANAC
jgi:Fe-S cluster assembly iron-binding protein IscA